MTNQSETFRFFHLDDEDNFFLLHDVQSNGTRVNVHRTKRSDTKSKDPEDLPLFLKDPQDYLENSFNSLGFLGSG